MRRLLPLLIRGLGILPGLLGLALWAAPAAFAQESPPPAQITAVDQTRFPLVTVYVAAPAAAGRPATEFRLTENNLAVQPQRRQGPGETGLITTLFVVEASTDMQTAGQMAAAQKVVQNYIAHMLPGDQAGLLVFDSTVRYAEPITANRTRLTQAVERLTGQGGAILYDALAQGADVLEAQPGRRALVVLSLGQDHGSRHSLLQFVDTFSRRYFSMTLLELNTAPAGAPAVSTLGQLASLAGVRYLRSADLPALQRLAADDSQAVHDEFAFQYSAPAGSGARRIAVTGPNGAQAQARYLPPNNQAIAAPPPEADEPLSAGWLLAGMVTVPLVATAATLTITRAGPAGWRRLRQKRPAVTAASAAADLPWPVFPNYLQLRTRAWLSPRFWAWARTGAVVIILAYIVVLFLEPATGLVLFWRFTVPLLPALFLAAPGVWRNVCPLAASNQAPRWLKFTRALTPPTWLREYGFVIGLVLFFGLASSRKWLFNANGPATAGLILFALVSAWIGGYLFKGKSGWCSSICPLYPVQRLYNQTPLLTVPNGYCDPCVGCTKNCYDFSPHNAYLADLHDADPHYASYRKLFAAAMPGFVLAFYTVPDPTSFTATLAMYGQFALYMMISFSVFHLLNSFVKVSVHKLTTLYGATAFGLYYWFALPSWLKAITALFGLGIPVWSALSLQAVILGMVVLWIVRTYRKEPLFVQQAASADFIPLTVAPAAPSTALAAATSVARVPVAAPAASAEIVFLQTDTHVPVEVGRTVLEIAESHNQPLEAGCRMGVCGADPVLILEGMEHLPPVGDDERRTLERLGLGPQCRLACMCRVKGPVKVSLQTSGVDLPASTAAPAPAMPAEPIAYDHNLKHVVIIGNGIAGVTAADILRRHHPDCEIHVVGREKHALYNRMAITRLIYGRSAMSGLSLQPEAWYDERHITCWLNTHATQIRRGRKEVVLATGEVLPYDRLILATGSSSSALAVPGCDLPGTFGLREAEEAMDIRAYIQHQHAQTAVVAGGGLLGLEAAYALLKLGLAVTVLERGEGLLRRQLDARAGAILKSSLEALGLTILTRAETAAVEGDGRVERVTLSDGRTLDCDVFLAAVGIRPNIDLAQAAGLEVRRGVRVDAAMRTSAADIFAAGDVCEFAEDVPGLWAVAVEQARVAALNALGEEATYEPPVPLTMLKVVGIDLTSIGRFEAKPRAGFEIALEDKAARRYRKLVVVDGRLVGAILLGYPQDAPAVTAAVKEGRDVRYCLDALRAGQWGLLGEPAPAAQPSAPEAEAATPGDGAELPRWSWRRALQRLARSEPADPTYTIDRES